MAVDYIEELRKRNDALNDKLSPSTYAWKQVRNIILNVGGMVGGGSLGYSLGKTLSPHQGLSRKTEAFVRILGASPAAISKMGFKHVAAGVGAVMGWIVAISIMGYEHWAKGESARLSIDEINRDISQAKLRMDPEIKRENEVLREVIEKQDKIIKSQHTEAPTATIALKGASVEPPVHIGNFQARETV
ncbi:MAG: hypothetical protein SFW64_04235 [Alphaproteobacteria bacterium]|nr:hypothetical protein [Alphaproteobacteria bacterium]